MHTITFAVTDYDFSEDTFTATVTRTGERGSDIFDGRIPAGLLALLVDNFDEPEEFVGNSYSVTVH